MFGYVRPAEHRLDEEERGRFRAAYCGLCHTLGRRFGLAARFLLNFDFTLLAILLSDGTEKPCGKKRCPAHPFCPVSTQRQDQALDRAAERSVILAWWQLQDHIADHGFLAGLKYRLAALLLRGAYRKAQKAAPEFDALVREQLAALAALEKTDCASLDAAADPFAVLLSHAADCVAEERKRRILQQLLYHLGRWIYLVDAADDFAADAKKGCYNPIRLRYGLEGESLTQEVREALGRTMDASLRQMAAAYALCDFGVWTRVLDSIFYDSVYGIGNAVLNGTYHKALRMPHSTKNEETL